MRSTSRQSLQPTVCLYPWAPLAGTFIVTQDNGEQYMNPDRSSNALDMTGPDTGTLTNIGQRPSAEQQAAAAFRRAAVAILRRAQEAQASAGAQRATNYCAYPLAKKAPDPAPMTPGSSLLRLTMAGDAKPARRKNEC
jgi:hypothetical protein